MILANPITQNNYSGIKKEDAVIVASIINEKDY